MQIYFVFLVLNIEKYCLIPLFLLGAFSRQNAFSFLGESYVTLIADAGLGVAFWCTEMWGSVVFAGGDTWWRAILQGFVFSASYFMVLAFVVVIVVFIGTFSWVGKYLWRLFFFQIWSVMMVETDELWLLAEYFIKYLWWLFF